MRTVLLAIGRLCYILMMAIAIYFGLGMNMAMEYMANAFKSG
jgi:hypothetical protein